MKFGYLVDKITLNDKNYWSYNEVNCQLTMLKNKPKHVMKCKSTGSSVATFLGTDNLGHPYNSIVYCGNSFPYSIQIVNDISTRSYISIYTYE